jgi:AcrR family transcriptional regulator
VSSDNTQLTQYAFEARDWGRMEQPERTPGRREQNKADKWERILAAATKLFAERGYAATTTDIARAAGIGTGSLFLYVPSKEHLLVAVFRKEMDAAWERAVSSADRGATLDDQLMQVFNHVLDFCEESPELLNVYVKVMPFISDVPRSVAFASGDHYMDMIVGLLSEAQRDRRLQQDAPLETLSMNLYAVFLYHLQRGVAGHVASAQCRSDLRDSVQLQLRGLLPEPPVR